MNVFPITKSSDEYGDIDEILGYQIIDKHGAVIASGETEEEAREKALLSMYLSESNAEPPKKIKLGGKMLGHNMLSKTANLAK